MFSMNPIRIINGVLILVGLLWFKPLAYFVGVMLIVAGLTGFCPLEKLLNKCGAQSKCSIK